jgi:hypothetical protein
MIQQRNTAKPGSECTLSEKVVFFIKLGHFLDNTKHDRDVTNFIYSNKLNKGHRIIIFEDIVMFLYLFVSIQYIA